MLIESFRDQSPEIAPEEVWSYWFRDRRVFYVAPQYIAVISLARCTMSLGKLYATRMEGLLGPVTAGAQIFSKSLPMGFASGGILI